ncbi:uncharacterized protein LOC106138876 isoform X2 [Amyelois transitella]|uniref:uncharacterized protein LOC106138876 isoform X2 n=1 Tax=Amyelois transitella TaxID=680683 RepID=UPI0029903AF9|nr:uncharacterized protein LOC106138876 isoform X2 [Amyelois transitella]
MERRRRPARLDVDPMTKVTRRREKPRERWLLTRKTWKYMSDAGRRLIPDGAQNRPEDLPRIEAYFQDVCAKEPRFLLWRKSSYPGALPKPRRKKRPRGGSVRARSPSDDAPPPARPTDLFIGHTSGGRFDIAKLRRDFFATPPTPSISGFNSGSTTALNAAAKADEAAKLAEEEESTLVDLLRKYLKIEEDKGVTKSSENEELNRALRRYLKRQADKAPADSDTDPSQRTLLDNLSRYYCRSPNRDHIVQDILTDRSLLKRLYHDLRKTKPYRGGRTGGSSGGGYRPSGFPSGSNLARGGMRTQTFGYSRVVSDGEDSMRSPPMSPPPLIEVCELPEDKFVDCGTQTLPIPEEVLLELERVYREKQEAATAPTSPTSPPPDRKPTRRRSSVDHDDVSQSVSDTIKRYLRMARKKSVDADKADRFKRINYDKNLRNIKPRAPGEVDDDGPHKGCQTEEGWILTYRELQFASVASTPTSPPSPASPSQSQSFLSTLLGRSGPTMAPPAGGMQKSRSTGSVVLQSVSRKLFRTRSRSSSRATAWTPQGSCRWVDSSGRCVRLADTSLLSLTEVERRALQQVALAKLQEMKLGIPIKIPEENTPISATAKPKRRAILLKKKALTTGFFEQTRKDDKDKDTPGAVFGVPLTQCVEAEKALRRQQLLGSRASLASLSALEKGDDNESCDSGDWAWTGLEDAEGVPKVPAVVNACLTHLRRYGLHTIGLFRVSASKKRVRQLREEWERCQSSPLDQTTCPHDVATLLKEFLRDLPDPLLCRDLYQAFLHTQKIRSRRTQLEAIRLLVQLLPAAHRDTLSALLAFLAQLAACAACGGDGEPAGNRMTPANLATVFAPNILHRNKPNEPASSEQLSERVDVINVVRTLMERQTELWTLPAETLHQAYVQLLHTQPACLDALLLRRVESAAVEQPAAGAAEGARRTWSREEFLHGAAATGGQDANSSEKTYTRTRRTREASDTSSGSISSAMTIVTSRLRSSEASSGVGSASHARDSAADSYDSASDYNETAGGSDDDSCVIKGFLHIPAPRPAPPPRRRSVSGSDSSNKRDSAVGSSPASAVGSSAASASASPSGASASASATSSPPASPPPIMTSASAVRVVLSATGEVRRTTRPADIDIDRLISLGRERNTSDARAVVLRQHDENNTAARRSNRQEQIHRREDHARREEQTHRREEQNSRREEHTHRREEQNSRREEHTHRREEQNSRREEHTHRREEQNSRRDETKREGATLYKRGELISSARSPT